MSKKTLFLLIGITCLMLFTGCKERKNAEALIDVDLTALSSTMVFAEVYNIMFHAEDYVGKTVKVQGQYAAYYFPEADQYYHAVIVADALACCAQGLEFVWDGSHQYPEDYPAPFTQIEISGVFRMGQDGENSYIYILTEELVLME